MEHWVTSLSAIAAFATALAALMTVLEMRRQRRAMYRPDFALLQCAIHAHRDDSGRILLSNSPQATPQSFQPFEGLQGVTVPVANIGMGSCKNLKVKWEYDVLDFARVIKHLDEDDVFEITYDRHWLTIEGKLEWLLSSAHNLPMQNDELVPYIVPVMVRSEPVEIRIPLGYLALYEAWLHLVLGGFEKATTVEKETGDPPPLKLMLQYQDIGNAQMSQEYEIVFHCGVFMPHEPDKGEVRCCMSGHAKPTRLK